MEIARFWTSFFENRLYWATQTWFSFPQLFSDYLQNFLKGGVILLLDLYFFWTKKNINFKSIVLRAQKAVGAQILTRFKAFGIFWRSDVDFGKSYVDFRILVSFSISKNKFLVLYIILSRNHTKNAMKSSVSGQKIISLKFLSVCETFRISLLMICVPKQCWIEAN